MGNYILNERGFPEFCADQEKWSRWFEKADRSVSNTTIGDVQVSTVFLGMDLNYSGKGKPILLETMIFGGEYVSHQERYTSKTQAVRGHAKALAMVEYSVAQNGDTALMHPELFFGGVHTNRKIPDPVYAEVSWNWHDIENQRPNWTQEQCEDWLNMNAGDLQDIMIERGNQFIADELPYEVEGDSECT